MFIQSFKILFNLFLFNKKIEFKKYYLNILNLFKCHRDYVGFIVMSDMLSNVSCLYSILMISMIYLINH